MTESKEPASSVSPTDSPSPLNAASPEPGGMREPRGPLQIVRRGARKIPFKLCIVVVALSLYVQEFFPLSSFPMYASPNSRSTVLFVSDGADQPIALQDRTGLRTARIKKIYGQSLDQLRADAPRENGPSPSATRKLAARRTLEFIYRESGKLGPTLPAVLRLWNIDVVRRGDIITFRHTLLGEFVRP